MTFSACFYNKNEQILKIKLFRILLFSYSKVAFYMTKTLTDEQCQKILNKKLSDLTMSYGDPETNFVNMFVMDLPNHPHIENVDNDPLREKSFAEATTEGINAAVAALEKNNIEYDKPLAQLAAKERVKQTAIPKQLEGVKTKDKMKNRL